MTGETSTRAKVQILNKRGLHARASAKFVATVARFKVEVAVIKDDTEVSGRSIMGLMMLGAGIGSSLEISAKGAEAEPAMAALVALVAAKFDEDD